MRGGAVASPTSATGSRHSPMLAMPASAVTRSAVARSAYLIVAWLSDSRGCASCDRRRHVDAVQGEQAFHRCAASSGSSSAPAASASRTSVDRCGRLRAACRPPTMLNAGWWPFSQDRNATPVL